MASQAIKLVISPRGKPISTLPEECTVPRNAPASEIYQQLASAARISIHRLRVTKGSDGLLVPNDRDIMISRTGLMDGSKVYVKDLGPQIGWRTCYLIEYMGPLLIHPLFYLLRPYLYFTTKAPPPSALQALSILLICIHFAKRVYETIFVHRFSAATMPYFNVFKNSAHYWVLAGINLAYWIYNPNGPTAKSVNPPVTYPGLLLYCVGQIGTLNSHLILRRLRSAGGKERGIPHGPGFNLVTCPNYMFETMVWVGMCLITRSLATVLFSVVGITQMALWARKKENNYRREFGNRYKSKRYSILPGIF